MKTRICMALLAMTIFLAGCSKPASGGPEPIGGQDKADTTAPQMFTTQDTEPTSSDSAVFLKEYTLSDFLPDDIADSVCFVPKSADYIKTEQYHRGKEAYTTTQLVDGELKDILKDIRYHITTIYEFDENGMLTYQREKYTFFEWSIANSIYHGDMVSRADYTNAKLVSCQLYADVSEQYLDKALSKQDLVDSLYEEERKYYMSVPIQALAQREEQEAFLNQDGWIHYGGESPSFDVLYTADNMISLIINIGMGIAETTLEEVPIIENQTECRLQSEDGKEYTLILIFTQERLKYEVSDASQVLLSGGMSPK